MPYLISIQGVKELSLSETSFAKDS